MTKHTKRNTEERRNEAIKRQEERDTRTDDRQLNLLDRKFGATLGARKERTKLKKRMEEAWTTSQGKDS